MNSPQIQGVSVIELAQVSDERGSILHVLRADEPGFLGFGECYLSEVLTGVVKAWKRHSLQTQEVAVPVGRIRMVIYDDRENAETKGQLQLLELGRPDAYYRLRIPPGLWYGFQCISDGPALLVNCPDLPHDPAEAQQRPMNDPNIPYQWTTQEFSTDK